MIALRRGALMLMLAMLAACTAPGTATAPEKTAADRTAPGTATAPGQTPPDPTAPATPVPTDATPADPVSTGTAPTPPPSPPAPDQTGAITDTVKATPGQVDYSCTTDADCAIKEIGNCCGYYPACVNRQSPTFPDQVQAACAASGNSSICGFPSLRGCQCTQGRCEGISGIAPLQESVR